MSKPFTPEEIKYDAATDIFTIGDIRFSGDFFRYFRTPILGALYRIEREDGVVTVTEIHAPYPKVP